MKLNIEVDENSIDGKILIEYLQNKNLIADKNDDLKTEFKYRFYKGQPVICWDNNNVNNKNEDFLDSIYKNKFKGLFTWDCCEPNKDLPSFINWIEWHGGECPVENDTWVLVHYQRGDLGATSYAKNLEWLDKGNPWSIICYAIIPKIEWL